MRLTTILNKLCCPFDKEDLELTSSHQDNDKITEGYLTCTFCERVYPIIKGIPIMNPDEYREFELEKPLFDKWKISVNTKFVLEDDQNVLRIK